MIHHAPQNITNVDVRNRLKRKKEELPAAKFSTVLMLIFNFFDTNKRSFKNYLFLYVFPLEGNFDIDAGDGGWGGVTI